MKPPHNTLKFKPKKTCLPGTKKNYGNTAAFFRKNILIK